MCMENTYKNKILRGIDMEKMVQITENIYLNGHLRNMYRHKSCKPVREVYPYCPYCGKKITHIKFLDNRFKEILVGIYESKGFVCE